MLVPPTFVAQLARGRCILGDVFLHDSPGMELVHSPCVSRQSRGCGTAGLRTSRCRATLCLVTRKCSYNCWSDFRVLSVQQKVKQTLSLLPVLQSASSVMSLQTACKLGCEMQVRSPLCHKQCSYFACRVQMSRQGETWQRL